MTTDLTQARNEAAHILDTLAALPAARPRALKAACLGVVGTLGWYAMPDIIRSRGLRAFFKVGIVAGIGWALANQFEETESYRDLANILDEDDCPKADDTGFAPGDEPVAPDVDPLEGVTEADPTELAILGAVASASVIAMVAVEKAIFRRGERRRAAGVRCAHLRQAVPIAAATAAAEFAHLAVGPVDDGGCPDEDAPSSEPTVADSARL